LLFLSTFNFFLRVSGVARGKGWTAPGNTFRIGIFDGIIACYIYPSLRIATSVLYLLID